MTDRVVQYPSRYKLTPVSGTSDTYDLEAVPGVVTAEGTPINKANLLTDATAAAVKTALELSTVPSTINEVLNGIAGVVGVNVVRIESGSYVGTGTTGLSGACELSFDFEPLLVFVFGNVAADTSYQLTLGNPRTTAYSRATTSTGYYKVSVQWSANGVLWYVTDRSGAADIPEQMNVSGATYNYVAIGQGGIT